MDVLQRFGNPQYPAENDLKELCPVYKVSLTNLHVTAAKAAVTSVLANNLRQRLFHVTQNIVWLHNST